MWDSAAQRIRPMRPIKRPRLNLVHNWSRYISPGPCSRFNPPRLDEYAELSNIIDDMRKNSVTGVCDCHVHVVGSTDKFPQIATSSYKAGPATLESLRAAAQPAGASRFVIVQPSFYGTDNSCLFEALDQLGESGRGVAVVDAASTNSGLAGQRSTRKSKSFISSRTESCGDSRARWTMSSLTCISPT